MMGSSGFDPQSPGIGIAPGAGYGLAPSAADVAPDIPVIGAPLVAPGPLDVITSERLPAELGSACTTPLRACSLAARRPVGDSCSCAIPGGRTGGHVTP